MTPYQSYFSLQKFIPLTYLAAIFMKLLLIIFAYFFTSSLFDQNGRVNDVSYKIHIKKATEKIVLDGILDEADWQKVMTA